MIFRKNWRGAPVQNLLLVGLFFYLAPTSEGRGTPRSAVSKEQSSKPAAAKKGSSQGDSFVFIPAKDLALQPANIRKATALVDFVEGSRLEENAEIENALAAYRRQEGSPPFSRVFRPGYLTGRCGRRGANGLCHHNRALLRR